MTLQQQVGPLPRVEFLGQLGLHGFLRGAVTRSVILVLSTEQNAQWHDDVSGPGNGYVDVFDTNGNLLSHFAAGGARWDERYLPGTRYENEPEARGH